MKHILYTILTCLIMCGNVVAQSPKNQSINLKQTLPTVSMVTFDNELTRRILLKVPSNLIEAVVQNNYTAVKKFLQQGVSPNDFAIGYTENGVTYRTYLYCVSWGPVRDLVAVKDAIPLQCPPLSKNLKNYVLQNPPSGANTWPEYDINYLRKNAWQKSSAEQQKIFFYVKEGLISPYRLMEGNDQFESGQIIARFMEYLGGAEEYISFLRRSNIKLNFKQLITNLGYWDYRYEHDRLYLDWNATLASTQKCYDFLELSTEPKLFPKGKWQKYIRQVLCDYKAFPHALKFTKSLATNNLGAISHILNKYIFQNVGNGPAEKKAYDELLAITREYINHSEKNMQQTVEEAWNKAFPDKKFTALSRQLRQKYGDNSILWNERTYLDNARLWEAKRRYDSKIQIHVGSKVHIEWIRRRWLSGAPKEDERVYDKTFDEPVAVVLHSFYYDNAGCWVGEITIYGKDGNILKEFYKHFSDEGADGIAQAVKINVQ